MGVDGESGVRSVMSGYAGRHRDADTSAPAPAPVAPGRSRRRAVLLAAAAAVVAVSLLAYPTITRVNEEAGGQRPTTAPPEAGLQLLGRQAGATDLADPSAEVGQGGVTTTGAATPAGQPPTEAGDPGTSAPPGADPEALSISASGSGSTSTTARSSRTSPSAPPSGSSGATPAPSNARSVARAMLPEFGFADSEFGCLNAMWTRLDRWGSAAQVRPGLAYIQKRYGTPCAAWAHVQETGQY